MKTSKQKLSIHLIIGARPNIIKIAPLYHALIKQPWAEPIIVHTDQHYNPNMSHSILLDFQLPNPDIHLKVGSGTHAEQTSRVMIAYEKIILKHHPDLIIVVGDVNSTLAVSIVASKLGVKLAHLEAGLRSFDRSMPEEINRLITDSLSDILWTHSKDADQNLTREGVAPDKIKRVGNIMIDAIEMLRPAIVNNNSYKQLPFKDKQYAVVTLHRPSNVDHAFYLEQICVSLNQIANIMPIVFPVHPRTASRFAEFHLNHMLTNNPAILLIEPMSYISFMNIIFHCKLVITDSGGLQEETTFLNIPCITLRPNTERPITLTHGTNHLCSIHNLETTFKELLGSQSIQQKHIEFWDGYTSTRVVESIQRSMLVYD